MNCSPSGTVRIGASGSRLFSDSAYNGASVVLVTIATFARQLALHPKQIGQEHPASQHRHRSGNRRWAHVQE
ncbi:MAG: hypothetical protein U0528_19045 [Anaerolineae bacterium]